MCKVFAVWRCMRWLARAGDSKCKGPVRGVGVQRSSRAVGDRKQTHTCACLWGSCELDALHGIKSHGLPTLRRYAESCEEHGTTSLWTDRLRGRAGAGLPCGCKIGRNRIDVTRREATQNLEQGQNCNSLHVKRRTLERKLSHGV